MYRFLICPCCILLFLMGPFSVRLQSQETSQNESVDSPAVAQEDDSAKPLEADDELVLAKKVAALVQEGEARDALELIEGSLADQANQYSIRDIERDKSGLVASSKSGTKIEPSFQ